MERISYIVAFAMSQLFQRIMNNEGHKVIHNDFTFKLEMMFDCLVKVLEVIVSHSQMFKFVGRE